MTECVRTDLWQQIQRRELQTEAHRPWRPVDGECRPEHERLTVLSVHGQDCVARRKARGVRQRDQGHGRGEGDRGGRIVAVWQDQQEGDDRRLWRAAVKSAFVGFVLTFRLELGRKIMEISVV